MSDKRVEPVELVTRLFDLELLKEAGIDQPDPDTLVLRNPLGQPIQLAYQRYQEKWMPYLRVMARMMDVPGVNVVTLFEGPPPADAGAFWGRACDELTRRKVENRTDLFDMAKALLQGPTEEKQLEVLVSLNGLELTPEQDAQVQQLVDGLARDIQQMLAPSAPQPAKEPAKTEGWLVQHPQGVYEDATVTLEESVSKTGAAMIGLERMCGAPLHDMNLKWVGEALASLVVTPLSGDKHG